MSSRDELDVGDEARAFVALGGNLGDRMATLRSAVQMLSAGIVPKTRVVATSGVYETRPVGPSKEAFLNAVIELRTGLGAVELLEGLLAIEARHGRERRRRWDARTLDLDLLVHQHSESAGWESVAIDVEGLTLPHPRIGERDFVLVPLGDLVAGERVIAGKTVGELLARISEDERTILGRVAEVGALLR